MKSKPKSIKGYGVLLTNRVFQGKIVFAAPMANNRSMAIFGTLEEAKNESKNYIAEHRIVQIRISIIKKRK